VRLACVRAHARVCDGARLACLPAGVMPDVKWDAVAAAAAAHAPVPVRRPSHGTSLTPLDTMTSPLASTSATARSSAEGGGGGGGGGAAPGGMLRATEVVVSVPGGFKALAAAVGLGTTVVARRNNRFVPAPSGTSAGVTPTRPGTRSPPPTGSIAEGRAVVPFSSTVASMPAAVAPARTRSASPVDRDALGRTDPGPRMVAASGSGSKQSKVVVPHWSEVRNKVLGHSDVVVQLLRDAKRLIQNGTVSADNVERAKAYLKYPPFTSPPANAARCVAVSAPLLWRRVCGAVSHRCVRVACMHD
jgi:hypothetical protein